MEIKHTQKKINISIQGTNSILDILKDFKKLTFNKNKYLYNLDYLKNEISDIVIVESDRNRWPNIMSKPSEIAFIFKK